MNLYDETINAVIAWLAAGIVAADYSPAFDYETQIEVFPVNEGARPSTWYLMVQVLTFNDMRSATGDFTKYPENPSASVESVVRVWAYGNEAIAALDQALGRIYTSEVIEALRDTSAGIVGEDGFTVEHLNGIQIQGAFLDTDTELRGYTDVLVSCQRVSTTVIEGTDVVRVTTSIEGVETTIDVEDS